MKKKGLLIGVILILLLSLCACGAHTKGPIPINEFLQVAEEHEFNFKDYSNNYKDNPNIDTVLQGHYLGTCWIIMYYFPTEELAIQATEELTTALKDSHGSMKGAKEKTDKGKHHYKYSAKTDSEYVSASRVDNTLLSVEVNDLDYLKTVKDFVEDVGC